MQGIFQAEIELIEDAFGLANTDGVLKVLTSRIQLSVQRLAELRTEIGEFNKEFAECEGVEWDVVSERELVLSEA